MFETTMQNHAREAIQLYDHLSHVKETGYDEHAVYFQACDDIDMLAVEVKIELESGRICQRIEGFETWETIDTIDEWEYMKHKAYNGYTMDGFYLECN